MNLEYVKRWGWTANPFTLIINPKLFTGYESQVHAVLEHINNKHKIALITGSTGAGKTTFLKWLDENLRDYSTIYVSKPPQTPEEFINIFTDIFGLTFWEKLFRKKLSLYTLPKYIEKKSKHHLVFLVDEAHETNKDVLEWLRVLTDQIKGISLVIAGLPVLEAKIKGDLETLNQRITTRIELNSLTKDEMRDLIKKRIESISGTEIEPFTNSAIDKIYHRTGGFPREVLKLCDRLVNTAVEKHLDKISAVDIEDHREVPRSNVRLDQPVVTFSPKPPSDQQLINLPYKQKRILETLNKDDWLTPTAIADILGIKSYKSRSHAIRSINNILHRLMMEGYVQRESRGKAYLYALTPKVKTLFVEK